MKGTRYFIEFPISSRSVDYNSLISTIRSEIKSNQDFKDLGEESLKQTDSRSYKIDYRVVSESAQGSSHNGTFYLRGVIG